MARRYWQAIEVARNRSIIGAQPADADGTANGLRLVCVVPVYLEQEIAAETALFWHDVAVRGLVDKVILVSTAKEQRQDGPTTHELIAAELDRLGPAGGRIEALRCEKIARFRAAQLDLAVDHARDAFAVADTRLWIGVYNADSRPQPETFSELRQQAGADPDVRLFQQLVDYIVPARDGTGPAAVGNSVLQTWWTLSHYVARNRRGRPGNSAWSTSAPYSTFGHGEFIRSDFLAHIGGFPDFAYADGLLLGWVGRLAGEPIGLLFSRDIAEVPRTARDLVTQQTAWMRGLLNFGVTVTWCRDSGIVRLSESEIRLLRAQHLAIPVVWGLSTITVAAAAATAARRVLKGENRAYDLSVVGGLVLYPILPALLPATDVQRELGTGRRVVGVLASWPVEGLAFWPALLSHLRGSQQAPAKTPR